MITCCLCQKDDKKREMGALCSFLKSSVKTITPCLEMDQLLPRVLTIEHMKSLRNSEDTQHAKDISEAEYWCLQN